MSMMKLLRRFVDVCVTNFDEHDYKKLKDALNLSIKLLDGRTRYNGDPFVCHSIGTALIVVEDMKLDYVATLAALLHDVARFNLMSFADIKEQFGDDIAEILMGMNNISDVNTKMNDQQAEHFKDMIISYSTDPRVILLKVADRTEVMRSLECFPPQKRAKKSWESLYIYSQIAHKLGYYGLKSEMEDLALKYLEPDDYANIHESLKSSEAERESFIHSFIKPIEEALDKKGVKYKIKGRTKSIYSIWRKMNTQQVAFNEVYDVFAIRIIMDCPIEEEKSLCWYAYSVVTDFYKPNPKRMRDWISIPKSNGYESLHATVVTPEGRWVEVQIRTKRMDDIAENGLAAHWRYKGVKSGEMGMQEWLDRLRGMTENVGVTGGKLSFSGELILTTKEVFVFTPNGDVRKLSEGATILDFAYDIHSDIGNKCMGGKVNHRNVTLREKLSNGDLVEIITSKNQQPRADWLNIVTTSKAKSRIKAYLREVEKKESFDGKEELERKIRNWKIGLDLDEVVVTLCKYLKLKTGTDLYKKIADDELPMTEIKSILTRYVAGDLSFRVTDDRNTTKPQVKPEKQGKDMLIVGDNLQGMQYKFASCCSPLYGDNIFGFVTILNGITIHRNDCVNGQRMRERYPYRVIDAEWKGSEKVGKHEVCFELISSDNVSAQTIRELMQTVGVELRSVTTEFNGNKIRTQVKINVTSSDMEESANYMFKQIKGVDKIKKIN